MTPLIEARGLSVDRGRRRVLTNVDVSLHPGEALALIGPNAAGKSTLLRALAGLLPIADGSVLLQDRSIASWPRRAVARRIALVASEDQGSDFLTVRERVALGRYPHRGPFQPLDREDDQAIERALRQAGIDHLESRRLGELSAGERQLASLARGLAQEPVALLLDEPAAHLDIGHQVSLFRVLEEGRAAGLAVLAVIHDLQRAASWAGRMALIGEGRVLALGSPAEVLASPECARAFGVRINAYTVPEHSTPFYDFSA
jgi:iron complex transport system ATP-binding protein